MTKKTGYNDEDKNVYNAVGGIYGGDLKTVKFVRDPDKLLYQYQNLLHSLGHQYARFFPTQAEREDLYSYIQFAFLTLVKEYDPYSGVDFPGYVASKLALRVYYSYVKKETKRKEWNNPLKLSNVTVEDLIAYQELNEDTSQLSRDGKITHIRSVDNQDNSLMLLLDELNSEVGLTELEGVMITVIYNGVAKQAEIIEGTKLFYPELSDTKILKAYHDLKTKLKFHLEV